MRSTTKKNSEITRAPREVCRSGHCAQPSIHQLATAVDPATADGGAAAAAGGPCAHPALGCCRRPGRCWRPGRRRHCHSCDGIKNLSSLHWIELSLAITSRRLQPECQPQPGARGLLGTREIVCDIGKLNHPIS